MAGPIKRSTFLVGVQVAKNPHKTLIGLYNQTLSVLNRLPDSFAYRNETEKLTKSRLQLVEQESNISELEKKINDGQIEEVIMQRKIKILRGQLIAHLNRPTGKSNHLLRKKKAKSELSLAQKMEEWKAWEPLQTKAPQGQWDWP